MDFHSRVFSEREKKMLDILKEIEKCNVSYHVLGRSDRSAMPIGNGELCASVWTNEDGEICFYMSRSDALTELDRTVKLGMVKAAFDPNPFVTGTYCQTLDVADGYIVFRGEGANVTFCIPPNENDVLIQGNFREETTVKVSYINWRKNNNYLSGEFYTPNHCTVFESPDIVKRTDDGIIFYHKNGKTLIEETAEKQEVNVEVLPDLLTGRIFGGCLRMQGAKYGDKCAVIESAKEFVLQISTESIQGSETEFSERLKKSERTPDISSSLDTCRNYWNQYWKNSYVIVRNDLPISVKPDAALADVSEEPLEYEMECESPVTSAYVLTRFMLKCCAGGKMPILYNGMLFNLCPGRHQHFETRSFSETCTAVPGDLTEEYNPDERSWCIEQLWQNIRHPYHTFLAQGDTEAMKALFSYYRRFWDVNRYRAEKYYGAEGQHNTEMTLSFGLQSNSIYGEDRSEREAGYAQNRHGGAVDISPGLELLSMMLDYYDYTHDVKFFQTEVQVYGKELYRYIETRFRRRENGKIVMEPLHSIETYWDTKNPVTVISGLKSTVKRLIRSRDLQAPYREYFLEYEKKIPDLPQKMENGENYLQPAEEFDTERHNVEIPELYACFPFNIYNKNHDPDRIMERTFKKRIEEYKCDRCFVVGKPPSYPSYSGWQYQGIVAARLGLTELAQKILSENVQLKNPGTRFPAMWGPIYDGVPDTDHGANIVHLLQEMVMQTENNNIYILPSFPKEWNVTFKLHPDKRTTVEAEYEHGELTYLKVTPDSEKIRIKT